MRDNFQVFLEHANLAFLTTLQIQILAWLKNLIFSNNKMTLGVLVKFYSNPRKYQY